MDNQIFASLPTTGELTIQNVDTGAVRKLKVNMKLSPNIKDIDVNNIVVGYPNGTMADTPKGVSLLFGRWENVNYNEGEYTQFRNPVNWLVSTAVAESCVVLEDKSGDILTVSYTKDFTQLEQNDLRTIDGFIYSLISNSTDYDRILNINTDMNSYYYALFVDEDGNPAPLQSTGREHIKLKFYTQYVRYFHEQDLTFELNGKTYEYVYKTIHNGFTKPMSAWYGGSNDGLKIAGDYGVRGYMNSNDEHYYSIYGVTPYWTGDPEKDKGSKDLVEKHTIPALKFLRDLPLSEPYSIAWTKARNKYYEENKNASGVCTLPPLVYYIGNEQNQKWQLAIKGANKVSPPELVNKALCTISSDNVQNYFTISASTDSGNETMNAPLPIITENYGMHMPIFFPAVIIPKHVDDPTTWYLKTSEDEINIRIETKYSIVKEDVQP